MDLKMKKYMRMGAYLFLLVLAFGLGRISMPTAELVIQSSSSLPLDKVQHTVVPLGEEDVQETKRAVVLEEEKAPAEMQPKALRFRSGNAAEARSQRAQLVAWAQQDPQGALAFVAEHVKPLSESKAATTAILHEWVQQAPQDAWAWAQAHAPNDSVLMLKEMAKVDAALAWETAEAYVQAHPESVRSAYANTINGIIYNGAYRDALELIEAADIPVSGETPEGKYTFIEGLITEWVRYSPEDAAAWVAALPEEHSVRKSTAFNALLSSWATTAPADALDFALTLPDGEAKTATMTMALTYLADYDVAAASEWINQHGVGPEFDWNIYGIATQSAVIRQDPAAAIEWAESITRAEIREDGLVEIVSQWMINNPDEAIRYLDKHDELLSEEALQKATGKAYGRIVDGSKPPVDGGIF